jgi:hypothetical protein
MTRQFRKREDLHMVILPGLGRIRPDQVLKGEEFARYVPHLLEEVLAPVAVVPAVVVVEPAPVVESPVLVVPAAIPAVVAPEPVLVTAAPISAAVESFPVLVTPAAISVFAPSVVALDVEDDVSLVEQVLAEEEEDEVETGVASGVVVGSSEVAPRRKRGRPRKVV